MSKAIVSRTWVGCLENALLRKTITNGKQFTFYVPYEKIKSVELHDTTVTVRYEDWDCQYALEFGDNCSELLINPKTGEWEEILVSKPKLICYEIQRRLNVFYSKGSVSHD